MGSQQRGDLRVKVKGALASTFLRCAVDLRVKELRSSWWTRARRHRNKLFMSGQGNPEILLLLLLLLLKNVGSARLGESGIHHISLKTPPPQYQPIDRKKRKGKKVEDYSRDRAA